MARISKLLIVAAVSVIGAGQAGAADLPARPVYKAPAAVPVPVPMWTGFYAGLNIGYSWGRSSNDSTINDAATGALVAVSSGKTKMDGVIGGGQIGYNWQFSNWVAGIEADIQASGQKGSSSALCLGCGDGPSDIATTFEQKLTWFGTVRGRLGVTITPTVLVYGTGGLAYGEIKSAGTITGPTVTSPSATVAFSEKETKTGWVVGGGVESMLGNNWTAKIEYLYMDLGTVSGGPFATPIVGTIRNPLATSFSSRVTDNIVRVGVNYKF
jgi:outer membrane immunogenic protein